jgi:hypothetical protein
MKNAPIPLVLDLWSLGHIAADIAEKCGLPNAKHVTRIVDNARRLRDPRAVLHCYPNGRVVGNLRKAIDILAGWPELAVVEVIGAAPAGRRKVWSQRHLSRANGLQVGI